MKNILRKANMLGSKLKGKYNRNRSAENWDNYKKQKKIVEPTSKYLSNKKFWNIIKLYFSNRR